jgi:hypothetical protein
MKKPFLRVTKWLRDIPVEAECVACPGTHFQAKSASHSPNRVDYQKSLQAQFDAHLKTVHTSDASNHTGV